PIPMMDYLLGLPSCQERPSTRPGNVRCSVQRSASAEGCDATAGDWHCTRTLSVAATVHAAIDGRAVALSPRLRRSTIGENTEIDSPAKGHSSEGPDAAVARA